MAGGAALFGKAKKRIEELEVKSWAI